ncbi:MAG: hypothetical protein BWX50_01714 [Euryarchaeota archaeon ADurb.Bin009]|nr:MAG: hypothetical protein BWX50_01714 [Euryarchaeota archaeon ADurb.Bin009]
MRHQAEHIEVAERFGDPDVLRHRREETVSQKELPRPGVDREDHRHPGLPEGADDGGHVLPAIGIRRPMNGDDEVLPRPDPGILEDPGALLRNRSVVVHRVDHHVPDEEDALRDPFGREVTNGRRRRAEEDVRCVIRKHPVHLFGHPAIETPEPRLDVRHRHVHLRRRKGAGKRRVRVPVD